MIEDLLFSAYVGGGLTLASTLVFAFARRRGWIGPLLDYPDRRALWVRVPTLALWLIGITFGSMAMVAALTASMAWVATALGWAAWIALSALGIGVALL